MTDIFIGNSIKHIRYILEIKFTNYIFSFSFCMNIVMYIHMLGDIGVICTMIRYYWPGYVYTQRFDILYRRRYESK